MFGVALEPANNAFFRLGPDRVDGSFDDIVIGFDGATEASLTLIPRSWSAIRRDQPRRRLETSRPWLRRPDR